MFTPSQLRKPVLVSLVTVLVASCTAYDRAVENQKTVYQTAKQRTQGLEVPPDLTAQRPDDQFLIPSDAPSAPVTASGYYSGQPNAGVRTAVSTVPVMVTSDQIEMKRNGDTRSLVVGLPAEQLWPRLRKFWPSVGLELERDQPEAGLMETVWAENRADIPMDGVRRYIGRVFDGLYSSNKRDKYRLRVEKLDAGKTEVFITHRGMEENYAGNDDTRLVWMPRDSDPELEAEMFNLLASYLTGEERKAIEAGRDPKKSLASVQKTPQGSVIALEEEFALAWRRVGFALDRSGFIAEDRDREAGLYYVVYSPDTVGKKAGSGKGFFGRLFFGDDDELVANERYQIAVTQSSPTQVKVSVLDKAGKPVSGKVSEEAVALIVEKL